MGGDFEQHERDRNITKNSHRRQNRILKKGFQSASLRNIVKEAGVTTGAFYGYYKSKEELFDALVGVQYKTIMNTYIEAQEQFKKLSPMEQQRNMGEVSGECMDWMVRYVYQYKEEFQLIL